MHTRQDYLNKKCSHEEYYRQFVTQGIKNAVLQTIGIERLLASKDPNLNDIPLHMWDNLMSSVQREFTITTKMKEAGDLLTLSGVVCITKTAAHQIINEHTAINNPTGV